MIYLIRHGETTKGQKGNVPLNENGIMQAHALGKDFARLGASQIYSSDVLRARQTTEIVLGYANLPVTYDERLREFSGLLQRGAADLDMLSQEDRLASSRDAYERAKSFIAELRDNNVDNAAVMTHRGMISTILYVLRFGEFDFEKFEANRKEFKKGAGNCSITEIKL